MNKIHIISLLICVVVLITGCAKTISDDQATDTVLPAETEAESTDKAEKSYTVEEIAGEYLCSNEYYSDYNFRDDTTDRLNVIFDMNHGCSMRIHYFEGACTVYGNYTLNSDKICADFDYDMTVMQDVKTGLAFIDSQFVFTVCEDGSIYIDKGFYTVAAGDKFVKALSDIQPVADPDADNPLLGTFTCDSGYYRDHGPLAENGEKPSFTFLKGGCCYIRIDNENGGGSICAEYSYDDKKVYVDKLRYTVGGEYPQALSDLVPGEYVLEITDGDTLTVDRGFYNVAAGDEFTRFSDKAGH